MIFLFFQLIIYYYYYFNEAVEATHTRVRLLKKQSKLLQRLHLNLCANSAAHNSYCLLFFVINYHCLLVFINLIIDYFIILIIKNIHF